MVEIVRKFLSVSEVDVLTDVRQNEDNPCVLAFSRDGGTTWTQFADLSLCPPRDYLYRYTSDGFDYQQSTDGGFSWGDARSKDPRYISPRNAPRGGDNPRCNAAASVRVHMHALMDSIEEILIGGGTIAAVISGIAAPSIIAGVGLPLYIFTQLATAAFAIGGEAIAAAFTEDAYHQYQCALYCHMDAGGSMSNGQYEALLADLPNFESGLALGGFLFLSELYGGVGLSNLGTIYTAEDGVDCSDCCPEGCALGGNGENWVTFRGQSGGYSGDPVGTYNSGRDTADSVILSAGGFLQLVDVFAPAGTWSSMDIVCTAVNNGSARARVQVFATNGALTPVYDQNAGFFGDPPTITAHVVFSSPVIGSPGTGAYVRLGSGNLQAPDEVYIQSICFNE